MKRFILALQFFSQDRATAMRLARLLADIEPAFRDDVEFLMVARFDTDHDPETISYVADKFTVSWITTFTKWTGWPGGPNAMALDTLEWVAANRPNTVGVLMLEADVVPTSPDWLNRILWTWALADSDTWMMGAWRPSGGEYGHVNGVAVFAKLVPIREIISPDLAWDCGISWHARYHWWANSIIRNCFQETDATEEKLVGRVIPEARPALVHGFKSDDAYEIARRLCGLEEARK